MKKHVSGFSKLSKSEKIKWVIEHYFDKDKSIESDLSQFWIENKKLQNIFDGFSENTITNFPLPFGVVPNFIINGKEYCVPMVIEESSVVAAASASAKYWSKRGGFRVNVQSTVKIGQVHFKWRGNTVKLESLMPRIKKQLMQDSEGLTERMTNRGGGIQSIELLDFNDKIQDLYQLKVSFETCDSMGANFINSVLELFGKSLKQFFLEEPNLTDAERDVLIVMSILSNYTPNCIVRAHVSCPIKQLGSFAGNMSSEEFAHKFELAIRIAHIDSFRATTHNKGIFNGIDAVVLATGNDFRAIEACGHTYASKDGMYRSLSNCLVKNNVFDFWLDIPLSVGTVGGLTSLHPMAKISLQLLDNPSSTELMEIIAATGLAQNFAAIRSLITTGIQKGHMKMHLLNILNHLGANKPQLTNAMTYFENKNVSFASVREYLDKH